MTDAPVLRAAVADYGAGNLVSIRNALTLLGAEVVIAEDAGAITGADVVVVPGVGASRPAMARLRRRGIDGAIERGLAHGTWYLGICLGLQLLFERSDEDGARMLGVLAGDVRRLTGAPRLPHIGWNELEPARPHPIADAVRPGAPAYFVHSYAPVPADRGSVLFETVHGDRFTSAVATGRIVGFQFHPERSGEDGLRLLAATLALVATDRGRSLLTSGA